VILPAAHDLRCEYALASTTKSIWFDGPRHTQQKLAAELSEKAAALRNDGMFSLLP